MRILLTNDDGIGSPGIHLLALALREAGHRVFVMAPSADRSGVSHAITFFRSPCKIIDIEDDTWACEGTPVDCVVTALLGGIPELALEPHPEMPPERSPPDLIISGINRGANLGTDILYSGTAAAARQGSLIGIPSLALSLVEGPQWHWETAVIFAAERLEEMAAYWKPDTFVNVNMPNRRELPSSLVHAFPSLRYYNDGMEVFHAPDGFRYCFVKTGDISVTKNEAKPEKGSDWDIVAGGNASISDIYNHPVALESVMGRGRHDT